MNLHQRTQCALVKFSNICLYSLVNASFKNLMDWHTCFLSLLYRNVVLPAALGLPNICPSSTYLLNFLPPTHHFLSPCFTFHQVFAWSFGSLHLQAMGKQCTNSNSVDGGDLSKGCRSTLDHAQGSPQGCNILFCHAHKAKMPCSQQTRAYRNAMSQSNIKGK